MTSTGNRYGFCLQPETTEAGEKYDVFIKAKNGFEGVLRAGTDFAFNRKRQKRGKSMTYSLRQKMGSREFYGEATEFIKEGVLTLGERMAELLKKGKMM